MPSEHLLTKSYTKWEKFEISYLVVRSFVESFILANKFQFIIKNNLEILYLWKKNLSSAFVFLAQQSLQGFQLRLQLKIMCMSKINNISPIWSAD